MSTPLLIKSKENIESAWFLIEEGKNSSSVHCAYYSCIQVLKHIVLHILKKSEATIDAESKAEGGSHLYLIKSVIRDLKSKGHNVVNLNNNFFDLKDLRVISDYKDVQITASKSNTAYGIAKLIRDELILKYSIV